MKLVYLIAPSVAFAAGRVATRIIRRAATAVGFVDKPDARRKLQEPPIPLGGGLAVWVAAWAGWGSAMLGHPWGTGEFSEGTWFYAGLAIASCTTLALGLLDDRIGLRGSHKLAGQFVAAAILVGLGFRVDAVGGFGVAIKLGAFAIPATIFWIVLVVNAFNLIDGMDGFCGSIGFVASMAVALLSYWSGRPGDAFAGLAIAGALAAFLKDNLPPARVYLGDAGSMTIGLMLAALSIRACSAGPGTAVSLPALTVLLALPLLDLVTALGRRWLAGLSLFTPDRGHIHHRLRSRLGNTLAALGVAVALAAVGACGATLALRTGFGDRAAVLTPAVSVGLLVGTDTFGGSELRLLVFRLKPTVGAFLTSRRAKREAIRHECQLHGTRDWSGVWGALVCDVEAAGMHRVELAIDIPSAGETFHGRWVVRKDAAGLPPWSITHAFHLKGLEAGILRLAGCADASRFQYFEKVEHVIRDLEARLEEEIGWLPAPRTAKGAFAAHYDSAISPRLEASLG